MLDPAQRPALQHDEVWLTWLKNDTVERVKRNSLRQYARSRARQLAAEVEARKMQLERERIRDGEWPVLPEPAALGTELGLVMDRYI